ncbi:MAG: 16S rRNA (uracil1498-N3)-methyltransferase [Gammaproteobacteria bacterium]
MRIPRVFTEQTLALGQEVALSSSASQHLAKVLRMQTGERVALFNGGAGEYVGPIISASKSAVSIHLDEFLERDVESPLQITLLQGVSRGERMDYTIQKAVELGVTAIRPLFTERTVVRLKGERLEKRMVHWRAVIVSACEQCGRCVVPELLPALDFSTYLGQREANEKITSLLLNPVGAAPLSELRGTDQIELLIGPEGGLNGQEISESIDAGFASVLLGPRVLRTETAGVVALSVLQATMGDI